MMTNAPLPEMLRGMKVKIGCLNMIITVAAIVILGFVFYGSFISISSPALIAAYVFVAWMLLGVVYIEYKNRKSGSWRTVETSMPEK